MDSREPLPEFASFVALADKAADNAFEVIAQLRAHISDLTRRLAEAERPHLTDFRCGKCNRVWHADNGAEPCPWCALAEAEQEACEALAGAHAEQEVSRHWKQEAEYQKARVREMEAENVRLRPRAEIAGILLTRTSKAEKRCLELEATIYAMAEAHAHDDQALTAAYLSGAHAGKKQAEAFKSRVMAWARGRCGACEHEGSEDDTCYNCQSDYEQSNWTPPQAWEAGE